MMGSSSGITRGQLRPHFSGRSPPFLVAALCVGLGILGVSYWSLSTQYSDLEEQLKKAIKSKVTLESDDNFVKNQLQIREDEFSRVKISLQKKEQEIVEFNNQLKTKTDEISAINSKLDSLKETNAKCDEELSKKENEIGDAKTKLKDIEEQKDKITLLKEEQNKELNNVKLENERLRAQLTELRNKLNTNNNSNNNSVSSPLPVANVGQPPVLDNNVQSPEKIINNVLKKPSSENKETQKSQAEAPNSPAVGENGENAFSGKQQESVISEPIKNAQQIPSMPGLGEEDKKEDSIVAVDPVAANEIADEMKGELNKEDEESNNRQ